MVKLVKVRVAYVVLLAVVLWCGQAWGLLLERPGYVAQEFAKYAVGMGSPTGSMTFADDGNLYITHDGTGLSTGDGSIYRISGNGSNVREFVTGLVLPSSICWGGGTAYGDYLYVAERFGSSHSYEGAIIRVSLSGQKSIFTSTVLDQPQGIAIDPTSLYGNMYVGDSAGGKVWQVTPGGQIELLADFQNYGGGTIDIAFDESGAYGNRMYVGTRYVDYPDLTGILQVEADGSFSRFATSIIGARDLVFDTAEEQFFGGSMLAFSYQEGDNSHKLYMIDPSGDVTLLARGMSFYSELAFGPDGALYVAEYDGAYESVTVTRIIPEPLTLLVLGMGGLMLVRRRRG